MQKRLIKALIFIVVALGLAIGAASAAGAISPFSSSDSTDGMTWGLGVAPAGISAESSAA